MTSLSQNGRRAKRRSRRSAGFTLVELMISLVMGLIIAMAAVGLAKAATTTFFEQARISGVEANVRTAGERFRNDLSRVSYMSTPNIQLDPKVAKVPGPVGAPYRITDLQHLQGLAITAADDAIRNHALSTANSEAQQDVYISGNLTSDDVYRGMWIADASGCGGTGGVKIRLNGAADPAVRRMFNGETTAAGRQQMTQLVFMPGELMNPAVANKSYAVQVMDMRGCFQYLTICAVSQSTEAGTDTVVLELKGDNARGILSPVDLLGDVCGGNLMEEVAVAPIQRVRWYIGAETNALRNDDDPSMDGPLATTRKFNLYRQLLEADGDPAHTVGPPEVIAEYAIDLAVGIFAMSATGEVSLDMGHTDNDFDTWASRTALYNAGTGPQRIRSVRYRMAFRAPFPDRKADLPVSSGPPYIARYAMGNNDFARVRTVMSEVALINQAKALW